MSSPFVAMVARALALAAIKMLVNLEGGVLGFCQNYSETDQIK